MSTKQEVASMFGCTLEQVKAQYRRNSDQLSAMADEAKLKGCKINGFTEAQLRAKAREYKFRSLS